MSKSQSSATSSEEIDESYDDGLGGYCWRCGGDGFILTCWDDLCHGAGYCMHGDGEEVCPECGGEDAWSRPRARFRTTCGG